MKKATVLLNRCIAFCTGSYQPSIRIATPLRAVVYLALSGIGAGLLYSSFARAATFDYLYIEAGEASASGGHVAIQFGDDVYHYQHVQSGLIRLFRQAQEDFHFNYRYRGNRPIHLSRIDVSEPSFDALHGHFKSEFVKHERVFRLLNALKTDRLLIQTLLNKLSAGDGAKSSDADSVLRLKGGGLFSFSRLNGQRANRVSRRRQSMILGRLRRMIERQYGPDFLAKRRRNVETVIGSAAPVDWDDALSHYTTGGHPPEVYSFWDRYADSLTALIAIDVLVDAAPLGDGVLRELQGDEFKLTGAETAMLMRFKRDLAGRVLLAVNSGRPDWGYAVLVDLARYLAVDASLSAGRWAVIDDFAETGEIVGPDEYQGRIDRMRVLVDNARDDFTRLRRRPAESVITEAAYSRIEMAANRYAELLKIGRGAMIRLSGQHALPVRSAVLTGGPYPKLSAERLLSALSALSAAEAALLEKLNRTYRYDLITHNCVTELFRTIDRALSAQAGSTGQNPGLDAPKAAASIRHLGGYVDAAYNFIPFVSERSVRTRYRVSRIQDLESYRGMQLKRLGTRRNGFLIAVEESNTLTSRLYDYNGDDAFFLFFTDDIVPLRPIFGAFNTAAGIGQSLYGLFSWPFDAGKNVKLGVRGLLTSLPELVFFNMRKGSYRFISPAMMKSSGASGF